MAQTVPYVLYTQHTFNNMVRWQYHWISADLRKRYSGFERYDRQLMDNAELQFWRAQQTTLTPSEFREEGRKAIVLLSCTMGIETTTYLLENYFILTIVSATRMIKMIRVKTMDTPEGPLDLQLGLMTDLVMMITHQQYGDIADHAGKVITELGLDNLRTPIYEVIETEVHY